MVYIILLIWNERSVGHIDRHNVTPEEVEDVCFSSHYSRRISRRGRYRRYMIIGQSEEGRYLTIFVDTQGYGVFYPVTARAAQEHERRLFQSER